jgi:hypothetical protein
MRISFDPMIAMRVAATLQVNNFIQGTASIGAHIERAHRAKLQDAKALLEGGSASDLLAEEAELRGIEVEELARLILSKAQENGDALTTREIHRQRVLKMVADAITPADIEAILQQYAGHSQPAVPPPTQ